MSKFATKVASIALTATTVISLSGFGSFAGVASAQMDTASLMAQIQALQAQLAAMSSAPTMTSACTFTRNLMVGAKGADVTCLQNAVGISPATGYFGSMTKAKVMAWQTSKGLPSTGYFGAMSRAAFGTMATPTNPSMPSAPVYNTSGGLWVAAGAGAPVGSIIAGAGQVAATRVSFTAPATTGVTVTGLTFTKVGVVGDSNINNLYLADVGTGAIVAQYQSLTMGVATFSGLMLNVAAGQTWWGELRADVSSSASAGNTIAFDLSGVTTSGNVAVGGLPVKGNLLTVTTVSNPSIATLTVTANAVGSTVDAGTNSVLISSWTTNVTNSAVNLRSMQFSFVGSANPSDIRNLRLLVNGVQVATLPTAATETTFSFGNTPANLRTGQATIEIFADVAGSPYRTFTLSLLQPYKVNAVDTQYGAGITASVVSTSQTTITINSGSITVQSASDSPSTPVPVGASSVTIAKFTIYAAGEAVKIKFLDAALTETGSAAWSSIGNVTDDVSNVRIIDEVGGQVGNTINTVASGATSGTCTLAASSITCHFGTSGSPINYTVPANVTRTLSLVADIGSSSDMTTLAGSLVAMTGQSNLEGQMSFRSADSGAASGATRAVNNSPLVKTLNGALVAPTYIAGSTSAKVASFILTASSAQAVRVTSLTFDKANAAFDIQNMVVKIGSTQFGTTRSTIGDTEAALAFSASTPIVVPAGGSVIVDVYADIQSSTTTTTHTASIDLIGWSAIGATSGSSITFSGTITGQDTIVSAGPTLTVAVGSATAAAKNVVMGSTNNELFSFRLSADNVDDVRVTDIIVSSTISGNTAGLSNFQNVTLWDGATQVAGPVSLVPGATAASGTVTFSLNTPVVVAKNSSKDLTVKADVATFTSGGAKSGSSHIFKVVANAALTAKSVGSATATVTVSGAPAAGNAIAVYRTKLTATATTMTGTHSRSSVDNVGTLVFTADSAYQAVLNSVVLKFSGSAVGTSAPQTFVVDLIDTATGVALTGASQQTCTPGTGSSCSVTFQPTYTISAGLAKSVIVRINSSNMPDTASTNEALSVTIASASDLTWSDGTTASISLEAIQAPVVIANLVY